MWRQMIGPEVTPSPRAASTNASSFTVRICPRTMRAMVSQPKSPSTRKTQKGLRERTNAMTMMTISMVGMP